MNNMGKILITGGNGLLGSNIVHQLNKANYEVVLLLRKNSNRMALKGMNFKVIEGDLSKKDDIELAIRGCDFVIHSAANTAQNGKLQDFEKINIQATKNLVNLSKQYNVKRFVFISTANCFTNGSIDKPGNEESGFMPWLEKSFYAKTKYRAQEIVLKEAKINQFPVVVLAPTFLIGERDAKISSGKLIMHALKKKWVFYPPGGKSFIDAEYAANAIVNALNNGKIGESYLLAGENISNKRFFQIIKDKYKNDIIPIKIPEVILKIIGQVGSLIENVFNISLPVNNTNMRLLSLNNYFSGEKAQQELELKPTNIEDALNKAINWFKINKYVL